MFTLLPELTAISVSKQKTVEWISLTALILIVLVGTALRLHKLDDKEFWHDESFTALVLSGHTSSEAKQSIEAGSKHFGDFASFKTVTSNSTPTNLVKVIGYDEPGHAPLFYFLEYIFCGVFGTTPYTMRLLCAFTSIATLPVIYWLSLKLYESRVLATVTTGLACLSPLLIYYAQEARDYSLGILFLILSTALLLHALKSSSRKYWIAYTISMVLGIYSWLFMTVVGAGHLVYVLITWNENKERLKPFAISLGVAALSFSPWLIFITQHAQDFKRAYDWMQPTLTGTELLTVWLAIPYKAIALFGFKTAKFGPLLLLITCVQLIALVVSAFPFRNKKYCLLSIIGVWILLFAGQDILTGGARSAVFRYQIPVIVSMLFIYPAILEKSFTRHKTVKILASLVLICTCGIEILSDTYMLNCKIWPDKAIRMRFTLPIANRLNSDKSAALFVEENSINLTELIDLSYVAHLEAPLLYRSSSRPQAIPENYNTLYLWNPSPELENELKQHHFQIFDNIDNFPYLKRAKRI